MTLFREVLATKKGIYTTKMAVYSTNQQNIIRATAFSALDYWYFKTRPTMLYDTYGEEYLSFLRELNEILSVNELAEVDYL